VKTLNYSITGIYSETVEFTLHLHILFIKYYLLLSSRVCSSV